MTKRLNFSNPDTRAVFETRNLAEFTELMENRAKNILPEGYSAKEVDNGIREVMFEVLGIDANADKKTIRKAIRRHKLDVYEVIEEVLPNLLKTGWQDNPFFEQFVEYKNLSDGDTNEFYVADEVILSVSELSGSHHNILRQRLGEGSTFRVKTSWYGVRF